MTRASAYPLPAAELVERVRKLAVELGDWPSQRQIARSCRVGVPRAAAALDALRREGFEPAPPRVLTLVPAWAERTEDDAEQHPPAGATSATSALGAPDEPAEDVSAHAETAVEPLVTDPADAVRPRVRRVPRWPLLIIAMGAFVSIWSGWVGLGELAGFGPVRLLPGIVDGWILNSAITLPLGVEVYATFAMWAWLSNAAVSARARTFARRSAISALILGAAGQIAYHLMDAAGMTVAPWWITAFVSCLPVLVLGGGAALAHLLQDGEES